MADKKPGRPKKERPEGAADENEKIWGVRGVGWRARYLVRVYATLRRKTVGEVLEELIYAGIEAKGFNPEGILRQAEENNESVPWQRAGQPEE